MSDYIFKWSVLENVAIYAAIALCTASVAYFAGSADGLWSLLLMLALNSTPQAERKAESTEP